MVTKPPLLLLLGLVIGIGMSADSAAPPEVLPEAGLSETLPDNAAFQEVSDRIVPESEELVQDRPSVGAQGGQSRALIQTAAPKDPNSVLIQNYKDLILTLRSLSHPERMSVRELDALTQIESRASSKVQAHCDTGNCCPGSYPYQAYTFSGKCKARGQDGCNQPCSSPVIGSNVWCKPGEYCKCQTTFNKCVPKNKMPAEDSAPMCAADIQCWIHTATTAVGQFAKKLKGLKVIPQTLRDLGMCLKTLPGGNEDLITALTGLGKAFQQGDVPHYLYQHYVDPLVVRVKGDFKRAVPALEGAVEDLRGLVKADGTLDKKQLDLMPKKAFKLAKQLIMADETGKCMMNLELLKNFEKLADLPLFKTVIIKSVEALHLIWSKVQPFINKAVKKVTDKAKKYMEKYLPKKDEFDKVVGNVINTVCVQNMASMTDVIEKHKGKLEKVGELGVCEEDFSLLKKPEPAIKQILTAVLTLARDKITDWLNEKVLIPLLAQIQKLLNGLASSLLQVLDGVAGLIPELGGLGAMTITVPTGYVVQMMFAELVAMLGDTVREKVKGWTDSLISTWSSKIAEKVAGLLKQGQAAIEKQLETAIPQDDQKALAGMQEKVGPILSELKPFLIKIAKDVFPNISANAQKCDKSVKTFMGFVKSQICPKGGKKMLQLNDA